MLPILNHVKWPTIWLKIEKINKIQVTRYEVLFGQRDLLEVLYANSTWTKGGKSESFRSGADLNNQREQPVSKNLFFLSNET